MKRLLACLAAGLLFCSITDISSKGDALQTELKEAPEDQKIKVQTELLEVRTIVTDRDGRIVENLGKDDFELFENDQPQEISFFSISRVESGPIEGAGVKETGTPSRETIQQRIQARLSGLPVRTTLLYVDTLHMSFSSLNRVKEAIRRFVKEQLTEQDMVALAASGQTLGIAQQFTRDRQILDYAIEKIAKVAKKVGVPTPSVMME